MNRRSPSVSSPTRRAWLRFAGAAVLAAPFSAPADETPAATAGPVFCLFTKHLLGMETAALADHVARLGFAGIEAPIRPGGHVEPERVEEDLPKFVETLAKSGVRVKLLTSGINRVSAEQHTEKVLRVARALGIRRYRMNWWRYDLKKPILPQLETFRAQARELVALSREIGIQPLYQNHRGATMAGAPVWDVAELMREHAPEDWGFAFDIMHATIEGGNSWPLQYRLARERIGAAYFKDYRWLADRRSIEGCPLGEGYAAGREYAKLLKESGFNGPVCLHVEYLKAERVTSAEEERAAFEAARRDLSTLREWWGGA